MLKKFIFLLCLLPVIASAQINKCFINGAMIYTDKPCPKDTRQNLDIELSDKIPDKKRKNKSSAESANRKIIKANHYKSTQWYYDYEGYQEAINLSESKNAPILIYGRTDWCGYCKRLDSTFLSDFEVNQVLSSFVKVELNPEHSGRDNELFKSWGGKGFPSLFVQSNTETKPKKMRSTFRKQDGQWIMISKDEFISTLHEQLQRSR